MTTKLSALCLGVCVALFSAAASAADPTGDKAVAKNMDKRADMEYAAAKNRILTGDFFASGENLQFFGLFCCFFLAFYFPLGYSPVRPGFFAVKEG
ncbi:MAG: hypothetical protein NVS9B4_26290 [Candidatus Acidiferrum sp.]